jgi:cyclin-dependent kinase 7
MEENWPGVKKLRGYISNDPPSPLRPFAAWMQEFRAAGTTGVQLLMAMLMLDPRKRLDAEGVLRHEYWTAEPRPSRLEDLPRKGGGMAVMGDDLTKKPGQLDGRAGEKDRVARKIDFGSAAAAA